MKNKIMALLLIINIVLVGIIYNLLNTNGRLAGEKQILKEMSTSEREQELDNKITELNNSATEYATYVQSCKAQIASAITERGVSTNETDTIDVMVENIKKLGSTTSVVFVENQQTFTVPQTYNNARLVWFCMTNDMVCKINEVAQSIISHDLNVGYGLHYTKEPMTIHEGDVIDITSSHNFLYSYLIIYVE